MFDFMLLYDLLLDNKPKFETVILFAIVIGMFIVYVCEWTSMPLV